LPLSKAGQFHTRFFARAPNTQRIVEHRDAVKVTGLAEQLPPPTDHGFDVRVAEFGGFFDAPSERFVVMTDEFEIDADVNFSHDV
jgi:hypothetical protein